MLYSPLRYPGGKNKLAAFVAYLCKRNNATDIYAEPYSGGSSVGLYLLLNDVVDRIVINDKDRSIFAFWYSVIYRTEELIELINNATFSINEWLKQKSIQKEKDKADLFELGFSTFYLNRTNRSGIISAGVMGGMKQTGSYLMDCRFKKSDLIQRIKSIAAKKDQITILNNDALNLIDDLSLILNDRSIIYFDPPYFNKASTLYLNYYDLNDHKDLSEKIKSLRNTKWLISYDNTNEIENLYSDFSKHHFSFKHTAYESRIGREVLIFSPNLYLPEYENWTPLKFVTRKKDGIVYSYYKKSKKVLQE